MKKIFPFKLPQLPWASFLVFFLLPYLLFTFSTYRQYGITADEHSGFGGGGKLLHYWFTLPRNPNDDVLQPCEAGHDFLFNSVEALILSRDPNINLEHIHFLNLLLASVFFAFCFKLLKTHIGGVFWALGGLYALVLTPCFSGHIPANPTDIPFAFSYFISLGCIYLTRTRHKNGWPVVLLLGTLFGVTTCERVVGFTLFVVLLGFDLFIRGTAPSGKKKEPLKPFLFREAGFLFLVFAVSQVLMALLWPYLGADYFRHFPNILKWGRHFDWSGFTLFMGHGVFPSGRPWYYVSVWLFLTMPVFSLVFSIFSFWILRHGKKKQWDPLYALFLGALALNLVLYLLLHPVIYDGDRQYLFIMPVLTLIAWMTIREFFKGKHPFLMKSAVAVFLGLNMVSIAADMVRLHPYEYIYFNELIGGLKGAEGKFETDYWGASLKEATEWLIAHEIKDMNRKYKIKVTGNPQASLYYFTGNMHGYGGDYKLEEADYWLVLTRGEVLDNTRKDFDRSKIIHTVQREGVPLTYILKLK